MTPEPPERYKSDEEMAPADWDRLQRTGQRAETDEFREYVRTVHEEAGLDPPEGAAEPKPVEQMTPDEHYGQIQGRG